MVIMDRIASVLRQTVGWRGSFVGWVRSVRSHKTHCFIDLDDGSGCIQVLAASPQEGMVTGASLRITGTLVDGPKKLEVHAESIDLVGPSDGVISTQEYPLAKKTHTLEHLRSIPQFRSRSLTISAVMRLRSALSFSIHSFFHSRGFYHVHTPIITGNDCEGAGELFELVGDFFSKKAYLTVSGQLQAEIFALSLGQVYTFGPTFRAEKSHTQKHLAEFWMVEPEMVWHNLHETCGLAKSLVTACVGDLISNNADDLKVNNKDLGALEGMVSQEWGFVSFNEAKRTTGGDPTQDLTSEEEQALLVRLSQKKCGKPVFVTHFPRAVKPFYMKTEGDACLNFDLLVPGVGELAGGSEREDRLEYLQERMGGLEGLEWYKDLRRYGGMPHAGFGIGFERLLSWVSGLTNIRDVVPIPRSHKNLLCQADRWFHNVSIVKV